MSNINRITGENVEIRILSDGNVKVIGKIPYNSLSGTLFDSKRKAFFKELISEGAFSSYLNKNEEHIPKLLFNHDYDKENKVISFKYKDVEGNFIFEYIVEPNSYLMENIDRIKAFSFGFRCKRDSFSPIKDKEDFGAEYLRDILEFDYIGEFSLLVGQEPAYPKAKIFLNETEMQIEEKEEFIEEIKAFIKAQKEKQIKELKNELIKIRYKNMLKKVY